MLKNTGSTSVIDPSLRLFVDGNIISTEIFNTTIAPGAIAEYTFTNTPVFIANANTQITVSVDYDNDQAASDDVISRNYGIGASIHEIAEISSLLLFPNPSNGSFSIKSNSQINLIQIYSTTGVLLESHSINQKEVNLKTKLSQGSYIIRIDDLKGNNHRMLIIE
jgi:hypothetical protein